MEGGLIKGEKYKKKKTDKDIKEWGKRMSYKRKKKNQMIIPRLINH
jgi:hypothetical protein